MKNNKGFTLMELLSIIVILAIIAVITVPIILKIVDNAKKGALSASAYGYKDAIDKFYVTEKTKNHDFSMVNNSYLIDTNGYLRFVDNDHPENNITYEINADGKKPNFGKVQILNNRVTNACLQFDLYKVVIVNGVVVSSEMGMCTID